MKIRLFRLKKFILVMVALCSMTTVFLNVFSTLPMQQEITRQTPDDSAHFRMQTLHEKGADAKEDGWTLWILNFFFPQIIGPTVTCSEPRIWPNGFNETEDRILNQLKLSFPNPERTSRGTDEEKSDTSERKLKRILIIPRSRQAQGRTRFLEDRCPVNNCFITTDTKETSSADAVVFRGGLAPPFFKKTQGQIWIVYILESPFHSNIDMGTRHLVNMTATYRIDSTIVTPYEVFIRNWNESMYQLYAPSINYAEGKTEKVAWFVSNCGAKNNRLEYARELSKYIDVDIYGPCGQFSCPRSQSNKCYEKLKNDYKFYLSFENSNCKDYITEKFYWNALKNDILPIVMGARQEDYTKVAPLNSFLHVDNFTSPEHLASYLHLLDRNDDLYNNYFRWKGSGNYINTKFYCRLCAMINDNSRLAWYDDMHAWWKGPGICVKSSPSNKYASWRKELQLSNNNNIARTLSTGKLDPHYVRLHHNSGLHGQSNNGCN